MKLTIIRLVSFTEQDLIDLAKVWPEYSPASLEVDETHLIYAARFGRHLFLLGQNPRAARYAALSVNAG